MVLLCFSMLILLVGLFMLCGALVRFVESITRPQTPRHEAMQSESHEVDA